MSLTGRRYNLAAIGSLMAVLLYLSIANVQAEQSDAAEFDQTYETAVAKAKAGCAALWASHAFDAFANKRALGTNPSCRLADRGGSLLGTNLRWI
jgi:hypothetical protein